MRFSLPGAGALFILTTHPVLAQDQPPLLDTIVVSAPFQRERADIISGVSILSADALDRALRPSLGETLAHQPGVSATSFGPNASRPILRGFQGERIRVLTDGIGAFDVSNTSVDHAVIISPQLAERIEVLRGPAALSYGASAVGGVVNVLEKRIPRAVPDHIAHVDLLGGYGSAANEGSFSGLVDAPLGAGFVAHVDGSYSETGDLRIGGPVLTRTLREQARASDDPEVQALADLRNRLPNTASRNWSVAGALAWIGDEDDFGVAVTRLNTLYGVPVRFAIAPGEEAEEVRIDAAQTRVDARAGIKLGGPFDKLSARFGFADYEHAELEDTGEVGTRFLSRGLETRLELAQSEGSLLGAKWKGATGAQVLVRNFNVIGEEAFLPENKTVGLGLFTLQELDFGKFKAEASLRYEHNRISARVDDFRGAPVDIGRYFNGVSGSIGGSYEVVAGWRVGVNLSRTARAPAAEELLPNGPHAGTQAFEIGDPTLGLEKALGAELVLRGSGEGYRFESSFYVTRFSDYVNDVRTGDIEDGLPVFQYGAADARYYGIEAQGEVDLAHVHGVTVSLDALADYVNAQLLDGLGPVPRIPPFRTLGGVTAKAARAEGRVEVEYSAPQRRTAVLETPTDGFTTVNLSALYRPFADDPRVSLNVAANNIADVTARRHASFLKDYAPLAGRDIRVNLRFEW